MGGFARYPWPQYISNAPFYYNKHYKRAMAIAGFAMVVNCMWVLRFTRSHTMVNPGYGSYIDPEHSQAPQQLKMTEK